MKVMEAGAVFLIIGGVLLGPIVPQYTKRTPGQEATWEKCVQEYKDTHAHKWVAPDFCWQGGYGDRRRETTAETCERALWEIGAVPMTAGSGPPLPPGYVLEPSPSLVYPGSDVKSHLGLLYDQRIVCIPAPSGLVR